MQKNNPKTKVALVEDGSGEGLQKAIRFLENKNVTIMVVVIDDREDIVSFSKKYPNVQIRYCANRNMFHCRTVCDIVPETVR